MRPPKPVRAGWRRCSGDWRKKGLVERLSNPKDARSRLVRLTEKGAGIVEDIIDQLVATNTELFADVLPENDRVMLADLLERLGSSLEERKKQS